MPIRAVRAEEGAMTLPPPQKGGRVVRGISIQAFLIERMREHMSAGGYRVKLQSSWIEEAACGLLIRDPAVIEPAGLDYNVKTAPEHIDARLIRRKLEIHAGLDAQVGRVADHLLRNDTKLVGPYSFVIRAAIRRRLRFPADYPGGGRVTRDELFEQALSLDIQTVLRGPLGDR